MEGKFELQFEDNEYYLVDVNINDTVATTDKVLLKEYDGYMKKLSLKNCQVIENGYDLDELAWEECQLWEHFGTAQGGYIKGFQKALELMSDKKFSEEDVLDAWEDGATQQHPLTKSKKENLLKSLQQTEWDVEIEMEQYVKYVPKSLITIFPTGGVRPKLDADDCLILKRKVK